MTDKPADQMPFSGITPRNLYWTTFAVAFLLAIGFAIYSNHAWEDYYITYRVSKNLATGQGLVFTPGERVHTFTSPLGVLIPAMLSWATGNVSDALVLWLFRILSAAAMAGAAVLLFRAARCLSFPWLPAIFLLGMFVLDAKTLDFTINGMETGLLMVFLGLMLNALVAPGRFPALQLGLSWAGLMWTRPDSFIYIGGLSIGFLLFKSWPALARDRLVTMRLLGIAALVAALFYLPWIAWAWHYYGSPVPNTVLAKGLHREKSVIDTVRALLLYPVSSALYVRSFAAAYLPPYAIGGWPYWLTLWSRVLAWPSAMAWLLPGLKTPFRAASLALMLGGFYLDEISPFPYPWYLPTCTLLSLFVLSGILQQLPTWLGRDSSSGSPAHRMSLAPKLIPVAFVTLALSFSLALSISAAYQLRIQQRVIEEGNRKQIGLYLAHHAASRNDSVFLEPLGYIGYFSQLKMLDFPGLSAPEVVAARKRLGTDKAAVLIRELKPDWLVLRQTEAQTIGEGAPELLTRAYEPVKTFDVSEAVRSYAWLPGRGYLEKDQTYVVFRRRD